MQGVKDARHDMTQVLTSLNALLTHCNIPVLDFTKQDLPKQLTIERTYYGTDKYLVQQSAPNPVSTLYHPEHSHSQDYST